MSTQAPVSAPTKLSNQPRELPKEPTERFWIRYSPHHELPISSISSIAFHVFIGSLLVVGAVWLGQAKAKDNMPLPFGMLQIGNSPGRRIRKRKNGEWRTGGKQVVANLVLTSSGSEIAALAE
jgi:hypothetical protein